jgi:hypothetical protein
MLPSAQNVIPSVQNVIPSVQNVIPSAQNVISSVQNVTLVSLCSAWPPPSRMCSLLRKCLYVYNVPLCSKHALVFRMRQSVQNLLNVFLCAFLFRMCHFVQNVPTFKCSKKRERKCWTYTRVRRHYLSSTQKSRSRMH